jgi:hypothetical protein
MTVRGHSAVTVTQTYSAISAPPALMPPMGRGFKEFNEFHELSKQPLNVNSPLTQPC